MSNKLFSVNRHADYATLRSQIEPYIYFSDDKVGIIIFSDTLENVTAAVADYYVSKGYHVGFLTDTSDAAHAYAVPNDSFRAYLRELATPIDNLQKMMDASALSIGSDIGLEGELSTFGIHWFRNILRYLRIRSNPDLVGSIPKEIGNLNHDGIFQNASAEIDLAGNNLSGSIPKEIGNIKKVKRLHLFLNNLTGALPREIGGMTMLEIFEANQNQLEGVIPMEIGNLTNLIIIRLNSNNFTGYEAGAISTSQTDLHTVCLHDNGPTTPFPKADINQICEDLLASVLATPDTGTRTGTLNLSGTHMIQPDGAGLAAAQSLVDDHGWTVTLKDGVLAPSE